MSIAARDGKGGDWTSGRGVVSRDEGEGGKEWTEGRMHAHREGNEHDR